jgi:2-oxoglutarate ferredoxin oxidoreductase subunit beta
VGVLRAIDHASYEELVNDQVQQVITAKGKGDLNKLLRGAETWEVR